MLFCVNPASVFYSAAYTESMYAAATFLAMLALEQRAYKLYLLAAATSAATRSNGARCPANPFSALQRRRTPVHPAIPAWGDSSRAKT